MARSAPSPILDDYVFKFFVQNSSEARFPFGIRDFNEIAEHAERPEAVGGAVNRRLTDSVVFVGAGRPRSSAFERSLRAFCLESPSRRACNSGAPRQFALADLSILLPRGRRRIRSNSCQGFEFELARSEARG